MRDSGLEGAVLVGQEIDRGVAQVLAMRRPELVAGLLLANFASYDS